LISPSGKITPLLPAYQQISVDGSFSYQGGSFVLDKKLCERVARLAKKAVQGIRGLQGYVGVDAILGMPDTGEHDVVLEINPRLTTSYLGLRQATTANLLKCMIKVVACDKEVPIIWNPMGITWTSEVNP
jgi:predicted ATP-grasp superfamily ATP-dependent carboligase